MKRTQIWPLGLMPLLAALVILVGGGYGLFFLPADRLAFGLISKLFLAALMPFGLLFLWMGLASWRR